MPGFAMRSLSVLGLSLAISHALATPAGLAAPGPIRRLENVEDMYDDLLDAMNATNLTGGNATNTTDADMILLCNMWRPASYVMFAFVPVWSGLGAVWVRHALRPGAHEHMHDVHKLVMWVPVLHTMYTLLSGLHYISCPWETLANRIGAASWVVVAILKEPVILGCMFVLCKGWGLTRHALPFREVVHASIVVTLLYACIILRLSHEGLAYSIPAVVMLLFVYVSLDAAPSPPLASTPRRLSLPPPARNPPAGWTQRPPYHGVCCP
jgi:hypothetical protein